MSSMETVLDDRMARYDDIASVKPISRAYKQVMQAHAAFRAKAFEAGKDPRTTPLGRVEKMRTYIGEEAHQIVRARKTLEKVQGKLTEKRDALRPKAPDKSDMAGAMLRSDYRRMLRETPTLAKRVTALYAPDADPNLLAAVLESPSDEMSGINPEIRRALVKKVIEREHPGALAALEREEEALELLQVATQVVEKTALSVAEFPNAQVLNDFIAKSVGDTGRLEADIDRSLSEAA